MGFYCIFITYYYYFVQMKAFPPSHCTGNDSSSSRWQQLQWHKFLEHVWFFVWHISCCTILSHICSQVWLWRGAGKCYLCHKWQIFRNFDVLFRIFIFWVRNFFSLPFNLWCLLSLLVKFKWAESIKFFKLQLYHNFHNDLILLFQSLEDQETSFQDWLYCCDMNLIK